MRLAIQKALWGKFVGLWICKVFSQRGSVFRTFEWSRLVCEVKFDLDSTDLTFVLYSTSGATWTLTLSPVWNMKIER
jgi:hypothetical protein